MTTGRRTTGAKQPPAAKSAAAAIEHAPPLAQHGLVKGQLPTPEDFEAELARHRR